MKDHYELNSKQNVIRQAVADIAFNQYPQTLMDIVDYELRSGRSIERLAKFGVRSLGFDYETCLNAILHLCPERLN